MEKRTCSSNYFFPMEEFHPNFSWAYGLESSDAGLILIKIINFLGLWVNKKIHFRNNKYAGTLYVEFKDMIKSIKENNNVIIDQYLI